MNGSRRFEFYHTSELSLVPMPDQNLQTELYVLNSY